MMARMARDRAGNAKAGRSAKAWRTAPCRPLPDAPYAKGRRTAEKRLHTAGGQSMARIRVSTGVGGAAMSGAEDARCFGAIH